MKRFAIIASISSITVLSEKIEYCSGGVMTGDNVTCEDDDFRRFTDTRNLIGLINCPEKENSANPNCAGHTLKNGKNRSYYTLVTDALSNYGCNCFQDNKRIPNVKGNAGFHGMPGTNGEPVDDLDGFCKILARRHNCLKLDFGPQTGLEFAHSDPNRRKCDYPQNYRYVHDTVTGDITCGPANNPNYANDNEWYQQPENQKYWNMNQCKRAICEMDLEFARAVAPLLTDPRAFWRINKNNRDISDDVAKCSLPKPAGRNLDQCCGIPEERNPFDSDLKQCCDNMIVEIGSSDEALYCSVP